MAKLAVAVIAFLFIFALSHARTPIDLPGNEVNTEDLTLTADTENRKIFLPSDGSDESEIAVQELVRPEQTETEISDSKTNDFEPVRIISFRPSFSFRHRRPCHHHHHHPMGSRFQNRGVSYGDDMMTSSDDDKHVVRLHRFRGNGMVRQIPARWVKFHHGDGPRFPFGRDDDVVMAEEFNMPHHHHHRHHHHMEGEEREEHEHEGVMSKIRKFLTRF